MAMSKLLGGIAVLGLCGAAHAYSIEVTNFTNNPAFFPADTRAGGSATADTFANDDTSSVHLRVDSVAFPAGSDQKVAPMFYGAAPYTNLGNLGELTGLSFDYYRAIPSTAGAQNYVPAMRITVVMPNGSIGELIWENAYNGSQTFNTEEWYNDFDIANQQFYLRADPDGPGGFPRSNYGEGTNPPLHTATLAQWAATGVNGPLEPGWPGAAGTVLNQNTPVVGIVTSMGSFSGEVDSYIDDITFTFTPVPEPASLGLLALGGLAVLGRRRHA
jgi:hypothetical protein